MNIFKKLLCKHDYIEIKKAYKEIENNKKIKGTQYECLKCGKIEYSVEYLY